MKTLNLRKLTRIHWSLLGLAVLGAAFLLATHYVAALGAALLPQSQTGPRAPVTGTKPITAQIPPCRPDRIKALLKEVRDPATKLAPSVKIDCSLTLASSDVITKRLIVEGASASGVTVDGNGATIDGGPGTPNYNPNYAVSMVEISSQELPPVGITLRNCKIKGSVIVYGNPGVDSRHPDYVTRARNNAPRNIVFDNVTIEGQGLECAPSSTDCNILYLHVGVSYFQMLNSTIKGKLHYKAVGIYLDDVSYRNTFRNNRIEPDTDGREVMAIDGSSYNTIVNNFFSALDHGGIYLYKNCGEDDSPRRGTPSHNTIINNVFYYNKYDGDNPSIFVASRNGKGTDCPDNFFDYAKFNVVMQNQIYKRSVSDMIKVGRPDINTPNYIDHNETVAAEIQRRAGCYISNGYPDFIRDGEFTNLFRNSNGEPVCTGYRLTCHDGALSRSSDSTCRQASYVDFECQATGNNNGCQKTVSVPPGKKIIGAKAACNLEFGTVSSTDLNGVSANFVKVLVASDNVSSGSCTLGSASIRSGQAPVSGINGLDRVSFGCRERDKNGGDCHIKGRLYYR